MSRERLLFIILVIISILLFVGKPEQRVAKAAFLSKTIFLPFTSSVNSYVKNKAYKSQNRELQLKNASLMLDNLRLRDLYQQIVGKPVFETTDDNNQVQSVIADVIGYSGTYWERSLLINKGSKDGIKVDAPVATSEGIVGKVITVNRFQSTILPLTNFRFHLPVKLSHNHIQGVAETNLIGQLFMNYIKTGSPVTVSDTVVVSNLSKNYPKYYPVGTIKRITESKDNLYLTAEITPFNTIENLKSVYIFTNFKDEANERD
ncbi:MAG: rod shape-determining protein MreC [Candidatus Zophobacter franzmannii]|nr:rod shape-determining protein MreC [Candidatus Zophobacter franzmannii]